MDARLISSASNEVGLSIHDADIGTLHIIQHELLKNPDVEFAGVILKHPLTNEYWMRVTSKSDPLQNIREAIDAAAGSVNDMKDALGTDILV